MQGNPHKAPQKGPDEGISGDFIPVLPRMPPSPLQHATWPCKAVHTCGGEGGLVVFFAPTRLVLLFLFPRSTCGGVTRQAPRELPAQAAAGQNIGEMNVNMKNQVE